MTRRSLAFAFELIESSSEVLVEGELTDYSPR
jgi:hypothetical protein